MMTNCINGIKNGDLNAFNQAYQHYHSEIYSFIIYKTQSEYLATEVTQLTFIRLWEKKDSLKEEIALNIQLFGMARQVMINELRKESTRSRYNNEAEQLPFTDSLMKMIESRDLLKHFEEEVGRMPKIRKLAFNLSRKNGLTYREIADVLGISPRTVESHIGKVLSRLKQYMYMIF